MGLDDHIFVGYCEKKPDVIMNVFTNLIMKKCIWLCENTIDVRNGFNVIQITV